MLPAKIHRRIYIVLLTLLGGCMVTSTWATNLMWVLLGANWVFEGHWREKWQMARESRLLHLYIGFYLMLLIGMLWTENQSFGWSVLQVKLPLLVVPLVVLTSRPLQGRVRHWVLWAYATTVLVVSIIGLVRMLTITDLPYRDAVPYISHIRFALNCCMVVYLCTGVAMRRRRVVLKIVPLTVMLWMLAFLVLLHSYTAIAILAMVSLVILLVYRRRWPLIVLWVVAAGTLAFFVGRDMKSYYRMGPLATEPLRSHTAAGNAYQHANDGIIENGNYINNYICPDELRQQWARRSTMPYDSNTATGYGVAPTLVRYMNCLGLTKDSAGLAAMTDEQIASVERGVANPIYESGNPLKKMVYVMLLEREFYVHTHTVKGFTMLQRLELWEATVEVIKDHPLIGAGTGDVVDAMQEYLAARHSELSGRGMRSHNQYLGILATLGILGVALLLTLIVHACFQRGKKITPIMLAWILTILISMLTEDTVDTLAGIMFCTWFLAFRKTTTEQPNVRISHTT